MRLFDFGASLIIGLFVLNIVQLHKDRTRCEKAEYKLSGCSIHDPSITKSVFVRVQNYKKVKID